MKTIRSGFVPLIARLRLAMKDVVCRIAVVHKGDAAAFASKFSKQFLSDRSI